MADAFPVLLDDSQDSVYSHNFANEKILADFIRESYQTFSYSVTNQRIASLLDDSVDNFFAPDFLNEVISANFVIDRYTAFEVQVDTEQTVTTNLFDDSSDTFYIVTPTQSISVTSNILDDSTDIFYVVTSTTDQFTSANILDDSTDTFYAVTSTTDQFTSANILDDSADTFYTHNLQPVFTRQPELLDDSTDTFFTYRQNYVFIREVNIIGDDVDKIFPVGLYGLSLAPVEKNEEFFNELKFDPYPAPITESQVIALTIEPVNFVDSGVIISNYPENQSANVSAFLSGKYVDIFPNPGTFKYVELGSSDLLQTPSTVNFVSDIPDDKALYSFEEEVYDQERYVDYTFTVDYRLPELTEINSESNLDMILWLDGADSNVVSTNANDVVSTWLDKSEYENHATSLFGEILSEEGNRIFPYTPSGEVYADFPSDPSKPGLDIVFSSSLTSSGDTLFVSALAAASPFDTSIQTGAVYVYEYSGGELTFSQTLNAPQSLIDSGELGTYWSGGSHIHTDGQTLLVGAPYVRSTQYKDKTGSLINLNGFAAGGVLVYENNGGTWEYSQLIRPYEDFPYIKRTSSQVTIYSGMSGVVSGDYLFIGDPYRKGPVNDPNAEFYEVVGWGAVHVYKRNTSTGVWEPHQTLERPYLNLDQAFVWPDVAVGIHFGWKIQIDGDTLAVSAIFRTAPEDPLFNDLIFTGDDYGAVYIYRNISDTWTFEDVVFASNRDTYNSFFDYTQRFGINIALKDDDLVVQSSPTAQIYFYERTGSNWNETEKFAFDPVDYNFFSFRPDLIFADGYNPVGKTSDLQFYDDKMYYSYSYFEDGAEDRSYALGYFENVNGTWQKGEENLYSYTEGEQYLYDTNDYVFFGYYKYFTLTPNYVALATSYYDFDGGSGFIYNMNPQSADPQIFYQGSINNKNVVYHKYSNVVCSHSLVSDLTNDIDDQSTIFVVMQDLIDNQSYTVLNTYEDTSNVENFGYIGYLEQNSTDVNINTENIISNYIVNDYVINPITRGDLYSDVENLSSNTVIYTFIRKSGEDIVHTGLIDQDNTYNTEKYVAEIIVYNGVLNRLDLQKVNAYLGNKWGIANTQILTQITKKYGDEDYTVVDKCGGVTVYESDIYTYSVTLNHLVTHFGEPVGTEFLLNYFKNYPKNPDC